MLKDSTNSEAGYRSHDDRSHLVGQTARTVTDLRPAGIITLDNEKNRCRIRWRFYFKK